VITPLWSSTGELQGFSKVVRDISERRRAEENVRKLSGQLLQAQDEERRRIARELHDSAGQIAAALHMKLSALGGEANKISPHGANLVKESLNLVGDLSKEVRTVSHLLHPPLLDELGLSCALRAYVEGFAERSNVKVVLEIAPDVGRLARESETAIFRVVQESLTNIHRHSGSPVAGVRVYRADGTVCVEVADQGKGIPPEKRSEMGSNGGTGVGIRGMRERLRQLGGALEISSSGTGTVVVARLPILAR
jgi:signal transduction histidine kinase